MIPSRLVFSILAAAIVIAVVVTLGRNPNPVPTSPGTALLPAAEPERNPATPTPRVEAAPKGRPEESAGPQIAVSGRVVDQLGNPLARCAVTLEVPPDRIGLHPTVAASSNAASGNATATGTDIGVARTTTGDDGRFELAATSLGPFVLTLSHREFPPTVARTDLLLRPDTVSDLGDLTLHSQPGLVVEVHAPNGQPVAQARIELRPELEDPALPGGSLELAKRRAISDAAGRGILYGVSSGQYVLRVEAAGYATDERTYVSSDSVESRRRRIDLRAGVILRGRVLTPAGDPDSSAAVTARPVEDGPIARAMTGKDGDFRLGGLAPGRYTVHVDSLRSGELTLTAIPVTATTPPLVIRGEPGVVISGTVREKQSGRPVPGATIRVSHADGRPLLRADRTMRPTTHSDRRGYFSLPGLPTEPLRVDIDAPGLCPTSIAPIDPGSADLSVWLEAGSSLTCRLVDAGKRPIAGASVRLVAGNHDGSAFAALLEGVVEGRANRETTTDGDGRCHFAGLPQGHYRLLLRHRDFAPQLRPSFELASPDPVDLGDLEMSVGGRVHGQVLDASGNPWPRANVALDPRPGGDGVAAQATADAQGAYELAHVAPGIYSLYATSPRGGRPGHEPLTLRIAPRADLRRDLRTSAHRK